uniref:C2H2-type domain-containing protein n=1 Tax=Mastacembelus armatus TaxID=205130 RepID=A0A3Q3LW62_9TELE
MTGNQISSSSHRRGNAGLGLLVRRGVRRPVRSVEATHSGERRYSCEVCGKRFKILGTLRSHEKIHTVRERPYLCHICCKTFSHLKNHVKCHLGIKTFVCAICGKACSRQEHLTNCRSGSARKTNSAA